MPAAELPMTDDYHLAFADWGESLVIETVATTFDPSTLQASEVVTTTEVVGIVTPVQADPAADTGGHHVDERCTVLLRAFDWPPLAVGVTRRLVVRGAVWDPLDVNSPALGQPVTVTLRRRE